MVCEAVHVGMSLVKMYPGWSARDNYAIHKKRRKRKVKQADKGDESVQENKESKATRQPDY